MPRPSFRRRSTGQTAADDPYLPERAAMVCDQIERKGVTDPRVLAAMRDGTRLGIPVFLYEQAASTPARKQLESIRLGGLQGLASRMDCDPAWLPDFGPPHLHKTAGAVLIGARPPLIAFNANLKTNDLSIAKTIARSIRQSNGGLPC